MDRQAPLPPDLLVRSLAGDPELTLLLDLDGTLIPFATRTEDAVLDEDALRMFDALRDAGIRSVIVSGRPQPLLAPLRAAAPHVWWFAEHGTWQCDDAGCWIGPPAAPQLAELAAILGVSAQIPGARLEPKSLSLCLHWRLVSEALRDPLVRSAELLCDTWLADNPAFERIAGVEMLEVRRRSANKGAAVAWLRWRLPGARFIAIGDDHTDEDMFAALEDDELAIAVGPRLSARCRYRLPDPSAVRAFLRWLVETRSGRPALPLRCYETR